MQNTFKILLYYLGLKFCCNVLYKKLLYTYNNFENIFLDWCRYGKKTCNFKSQLQVDNEPQIFMSRSVTRNNQNSMSKNYNSVVKNRIKIVSMKTKMETNR